MRIVVVDDDQFALLALTRPLRKAGYDVVEATRIEQVIEAAEQGRFDVAVVDIFMPGMGGIQAIERIHAKSPNCRIVAVTGGYADMPAEDAIQAAIKIGAAAGFAKPVDMKALTARLKSWETPAA